MPDKSITVGGFARGKGKELRVLLAEYQGSKYIDIRVYYQDRVDGDWKPTKSGVTVPPGLLAEFKGLLDDAQEQAETMGWT